MGIYRTLEAVVCLLSVCSTVLAGKAGSSNTETDEVRLSKTTGVKSSDPSYGIGFDLSTSYGYVHPLFCGPDRFFCTMHCIEFRDADMQYTAQR